MCRQIDTEEARICFQNGCRATSIVQGWGWGQKCQAYHLAANDHLTQTAYTDEGVRVLD